MKNIHVLPKEEPKQEQKQHLIDIMEGDEELGLYDEPKQETLEEVVSKQFQEDFNKEVGKVLTQELQKRESETPVEWIYRNLLENPISNQDVEYNEAVFHNAKEMEKEQDKNKYSEEEVIHIVQRLMYDVHCGGICEGDKLIDFKISPIQWFEKFKKK